MKHERDVVCFEEYSKLLDKVKLSIIDKFKIRYFGIPKYVGHYKCNGWLEEHPFYVAYCQRHKVFFIDYPHGYTKYLHCPLCLIEVQSHIEK